MNYYIIEYFHVDEYYVYEEVSRETAIEAVNELLSCDCVKYIQKVALKLDPKEWQKADCLRDEP